jgi:hypothetical protein
VPRGANGGLVKSVKAGLVGPLQWRLPAEQGTRFVSSNAKPKRTIRDDDHHGVHYRCHPLLRALEHCRPANVVARASVISSAAVGLAVPGSPCTAHDRRAPGGLRSSDYCRSFNRFGCPQSGQQFTSERRVNLPQCSQRRRSRMGRSWGFVGRVGAAVVRLSHLMQRTYGRVGSARTSDPHLAQYMAVIMIGSSRSASLPHVGFMMGPGAAAG